MEITIDPELKSLIPSLTEDETLQLEENIKAEGCREPLVVWGGVIVDGHNRYEICSRLNIPYQTVEKHFDSREAAIVWMIDNQQGRRNLSDAWKIELALVKKEALQKAGREKQAQTLKQNQDTVLSNNDKTEPPQPAHNTQKEISKSANVSTGKLAQAEVIRKKSPELWEKAKSGEATIGGAYKELQKAERKEEQVKKMDAVKARETAPPDGKYDVIVIDPPWPMEKIIRDVRPNQVAFDYPIMSEEEIKAMQLPMADDCHVWVWTTHKFLPMALRCVDHWGLKYICTFVWHKPGGFQPIGLPQYNCEFALYCRRGSPSFIDTKAFNAAFNAPRGAHSEKPEEFYEVVKRVTAGKRIDIFNRREIDGFDVWGNESGNRMAV